MYDKQKEEAESKEFVQLLKDLQAQKDKTEKALQDIKKDDHVRYSGEMNSSIFEMLGEVALVINNSFTKNRLENQLKNINETMDVKSPLYKKMLDEVTKIKQATKKKFLLKDEEEYAIKEIDRISAISLSMEHIEDIGEKDDRLTSFIDAFKESILSNDSNLSESKESNSTLKKVGHTGVTFMATELGLKGKPKEVFESVVNKVEDSHIDKTIQLLQAVKVDNPELLKRLNNLIFLSSAMVEKYQDLSQKEVEDLRETAVFLYDEEADNTLKSIFGELLGDELDSDSQEELKAVKVHKKQSSNKNRQVMRDRA